MNVISRELVESYLQALQADEAEIQSAGEEYQRARARIDLALLRYKSLRDFVAEALGCSPYSDEVQWPEDNGDPWAWGRYRYVGMKVGDAVLEVLESRLGSPKSPEYQAQMPIFSWTMTLSEITQALSEGGLGFPDPVSARAVNAARINTAGIARYSNQEGQTRYALAQEDQGTDSDPTAVDDLPFE